MKGQGIYFIINLFFIWGIFFHLKSSNLVLAVILLIFLHIGLFGLIHGQSVHRGEKPCRPVDIAGFVLFPPTLIFTWSFLAGTGFVAFYSCLLLPFVPLAILHLITLMTGRRREPEGFAYGWSILWFMRRDPRENYLDMEADRNRIEELKRKRLP